MIIEYEKNDEYVTWGEGVNWHEASLNELIDAYMRKPIYCEECNFFCDGEWCSKHNIYTKGKEYCSRAERVGNDSCGADNTNL